MKNAARMVAFILILLAVFPISVFAQSSSVPYQSFTHYELSDGKKKTVYMRDMFVPVAEVTSRSLGLDEAFENISDIDCDKSGNVYILTSDGQIIVFDTEYRFVRKISVCDDSGELDISGACGINAKNEGKLIISDTQNSRVLICGDDGRITNSVEMPDSDLIPDDFTFSPVKAEIDSKGYIYVLCEGAYFGAFLFEPNGEFNGFYGANSTNKSPLTTIAFLWDKLTGNDVKRSKTIRTLPFQFVDFAIDDKDFVYTCTGKTTEGGSTGQLRVLSPGGSNILYRDNWNGNRISAASFNFGEKDSFKRNNNYIEQNFIGIATDSDGFIYLLDETYGLIYVYDSSCNLLTAFGGGRGFGKETGVFQKPVAITAFEDRVFVADSMKNTVTVFERNKYGKLVLKAQKLTLNGDYAEAEPLWQEVIGLDSNSRVALRGLAKAAYIKGEYRTALNLAESGYDAITYSQALKKLQHSFLSDNFLWMVLGIIVILALSVAGIVIKLKRKSVVIQNEKLRILLVGPFHPFDCYNALKLKKLTSIPLAIGTLVAFYISSVMAVTLSNFRYTTFDPSSYNSLYQLAQTVGLVLVWSLVNWAFCILQEGKGFFREVFTVSCYATLPLTLYNLLAAGLSHLMSSPDSMLLQLLHTVALIFAGIVLTIGLMIVHEFSLSKFLFTSFVSICGIILIVFIVFMFGVLLSEFAGFIVGLFFEVFYR